MLAVVASIEIALASKSLTIKFLGIVWTFFTLCWTYAGFSYFRPHDDTATLGWRERCAGFFVGLLTGLFIATPAWMAYASVLVLGSRHKESQEGLALGEYLRCESVALWQRVVAVLP